MPPAERRIEHRRVVGAARRRRSSLNGASGFFGSEPGENSRYVHESVEILITKRGKTLTTGRRDAKDTKNDTSVRGVSPFSETERNNENLTASDVADCVRAVLCC